MREHIFDGVANIVEVALLFLCKKECTVIDYLLKSPVEEGRYESIDKREL